MRPLTDPDARPRRYAFALTPLADAMFQLLIFFMLSSSLSPYSLIPLAGGPMGQSDLTGEVAPPTPAPEAGTQVAVWHLARGSLRAGAQTIALDDLPGVMPALLASGVVQVLLFPSRAATVQDIATTLEVLGSNGIDKVQLVSGPGPQGG
jgi:biopolymer transport protein ExbD